MAAKPTVCIFQTDAGEGHKNAEKVIRKALGEQVRFQSFEIYKDVLADYDLAAKYLGLSSPDIYNKVVLQKGYTGIAWTVLAGLNLAYLKIMKGRLAGAVAEFLSGRDCDVAVALVPLLNSVLAEGVARTGRDIPLISVVTDFIQPFKGIWFQDPRQHVIVCTPEARDQALKAGIKEEQVHLLSGAPIDTEALDPKSADPGEVRNHLSGDKPVTLMIYGGHAGQVVEKYIEAIEDSEADTDIVCICGRNEALRDRLESRGFSKLKLATGFVDVAPYYAVADLVLGKPGPGVITEAAHMGAPLLLEYNSGTMAQERFNAKWAAERGIAETFSDKADLIEKLDGMLKPESLQSYRAATRKMKNNSMAEIKEIFGKYL